MADLQINGKQVSTLQIGGNIVYSRYFKPLEYIESTGTQYIDTGYYTKANTKVNIKFQYTETTEKGVYGSWVSTDNTAINYFYINSGYFKSGSGKNNTQITFTASDTNIHTFTNDFVNLTATFDSTTQTTSAITTTFNQSSLLFGMKSPSGVTTGFLSSCRIFYASFYDGTTLAANFIPCKLTSYVSGTMAQDGSAHAEGEIGMWDTVSNKFFANAGTGTFTEPLSMPATRLSYIQSAGSQYINLGLKTSNTYNVSGRWTLTAIPSQNTGLFGARDSATSRRLDCIVNSDPRLFYGWADLSSSNTTILSVGDVLEYSNSANVVTITRNGSAFVSWTAISFSFTGTYNMYLNALHDAGTLYGAYAKVEYFTITQSGTTIMNLIPCKLTQNISASEANDATAHSIGEIGMWDTVSNKFFANAGTGSFTGA